MAMLVLVMGYRKGLCRALENLHAPYMLWNRDTIKGRVLALKTIIQDFPESEGQIRSLLPPQLASITHVIAGTEEAVFPASLVRAWVGARRNPQSAIVRCTDKLEMKDFLFSQGIPMTDFIPGQTAEPPEKILQRLGEPVIVKPRRNSGGRGIRVAGEEREIYEMRRDDIIFERNIDGSEGSVESLITNGKVVFTNVTEYFEVGHCNLVPAHYDKSFADEALSLNQRVIELLNIQWGMTHLEFYKVDNKILFGEIAIRPPGGYIMDALELAYGQDFWEHFAKIELDLWSALPIQQKQFAASVVIHPPPGIVERILGKDKVERLKSVRKMRLKVDVGDAVGQRLGVGQDVGYALMANEDQSQLIEDIYFFQSNLILETGPRK
jgi:biotin carboxylase